MDRVIRLLAPLGAALTMAAPPALAHAAPAGRQARLCATCHRRAEPGTLRGHLDDVSMKARALQVKVDERVEVLAFDPATLAVLNAPAGGDLEQALKAIPKGAEARVLYAVRGPVKEARVLAVKPRLAVPAEKQIGTDALARLVELGPEQGRYALFDARPASRFAAGHLPTAVSLPFPAFEQEKGRLPADKGALVIFYGDGVTCALARAARDRAERLGYANARVYHEGIPAWARSRPLALSPALLEEAWLARREPIVVLDARASPTGGVVPGAAAFPEPSRAALDRLYRFRKRRPAIVVYDEDGAGGAPRVARAIAAEGYPAMVLTGGARAWRAAGYPLAPEAPAAAIAFTPRRKPGAIPVADFEALVQAIPADTVLLDVRGADEVKMGGAFKGSVNVPLEQLAVRAGELPRTKRVVAHCSSGSRAEMAYHLLGNAGFPRVLFLDATVEFDGGEAEIGD